MKIDYTCVIKRNLESSAVDGIGCYSPEVFSQNWTNKLHYHISHGFLFKSSINVFLHFRTLNKFYVFKKKTNQNALSKIHTDAES